MGGLKKYLPITNITFLLGCLAIAGVPPFSGFFSKDEILAAAYEKNPILYFLGVAGALMTTFYMFRLYAMTFLGKFRGTHEQEHHLHESPSAMTIPLIVLAILAVVGGFIGIPEVIARLFGVSEAAAKNSHWLESFLEPVFAGSKALTEQKVSNHSTELMMMGVVTGLVLVTIAFAWNKFSKYEETNNEEVGLGKVLENKWYIDELYDAIIVNPLNAFAGFLKSIIEKSGIDGVVNGVGTFINYSSRQLRLIQNGQVGAYILMMVLSMLGVILLWINDGTIVRFLHKIF